MHRSNNYVPSDCPMCGKPSSARMGNSSWGHSEPCCSEACGKAYRDSEQRARAEVRNLMAAIEDTQNKLAYWRSKLPPGEPTAPREVDVEALRQLLLRCTDDSRADYEWRESARQGLVREALALLDAEPREAPSLPAGFKRREWQEGWMYTTAGQRHVFVGRDGSITAADCDAATVHAVLCFHFLSSTSDQVGGGS